MPMSKSYKHKVSFTFSDPAAMRVALVGDFTDWKAMPLDLKRQKNGLWKTTVALGPGSYEYRYLVDGQWHDDPNCQARRVNPFGSENCVRVIAY